MASTTVGIPDALSFEFEGRSFYAVGNVEVEFEIVDFGIGAYECWGQRGFDSQMGAEIDKFCDPEIQEILDDDGDSLPKEFEEALIANPLVEAAVLAAITEAYESNQDGFFNKVGREADESVNDYSF